MKTGLTVLLLLIRFAAWSHAGVSLGWPGAVKKQVDKLDDAVLKDLQVRSAPVGLTAEAGNGAAELHWAAVSGAASYNLYWGTNSPSAKISGVTLPYLLSGLANGVNYSCAVTAVVRGAESSRSAAVSVTPTSSRPANPAGVAGAHGNGQITLSWGAVAGATSYNVYWSAVPGVTAASAKIAGAVSPYTHTGLAQATRYYYRVSALTGATESLLSPEIAVYTNRPPTVDSLVSNYPAMEIGYPVAFTASASDPEGDAVSYGWSAGSGTISGSGSSITWTAPGLPGYYPVTVTASDGKGGSAQRSLVVWIYSALDNPSLAMSSWGDAPWGTQTSTYYYGGASAQSGRIAAGQKSYLRVTVTGPGTLTFYWKIRSASTYSMDTLYVYDNGMPQWYIYGNADWAQRSMTISGGSHQITWEYYKSSAQSGTDAAWVDKVTFP